jgi:hypothetical protein
MSWITADWKLKLLGLGLSALLLLGVAYSQYPIQTTTVDARINYNGLPPSGLIVNNPPATTKVTVSGLAADIRASTTTVDVNLAKIKQGTAFVVNPTPHTAGQNVTVLSVTPITLKVEQEITSNIDIQVRATFINGWTSTKTQAICGNATQACQVTVNGPASVLQDLAAFVVIDTPISFNSRTVPALLVRFSRAGNEVDLTKVVSIPAISWAPLTATGYVQAEQGIEKIQVALVDAIPTAPPPPGYHVVGIIINPQLILITGTPDVLAGINGITLSAVSLAGLTSDHTFQIKIVAPDPSIVLDVKQASVTYLIRPNPAVSPSP